jgi:hypothetical protein
MNHGPGDLLYPCPTCTGPVTVTGDGPIVEVTP